jgi:hypothetical protein
MAGCIVCLEVGMIHIGKRMKKPMYIVWCYGVCFEELFQDIALSIDYAAIHEAPYFYNWEMIWLRGKRRVRNVLRKALCRSRVSD